MNRLLPASFYQREEVVQVARDLLGMYLCTRIDGAVAAGKIVETEAYRGPDDKACHAWNNRRTRRTEVMFRAGGVAYVYLCYGIHHLFNVVSGREDQPHAVLIRAVEPTDNIPVMMDRRGFSRLRPQLTAGPGVLSQALGIRTHHSGLSLAGAEGPIWLEDRKAQPIAEDILAGPRVGVAYAAECAAWPWRFRIKNSPWTSKAQP